MADILLVFIILKALGAVNWSWGIVLIPLWVEIIKYLVLELIWQLVKD